MAKSNVFSLHTSNGFHYVAMTARIQDTESNVGNKLNVGLQINHIEVLLKMINKETLLGEKQPNTKKAMFRVPIPVLSVVVVLSLSM